MAESSSALDKIKADMYAAMKAGDKMRVETLRLIISEAKKDEIDHQRNLKNEDVAAIIKRGIKMRAESIEQFEKGGRVDLVDKEKKESEILKSYLPSQVTGDTLKAIVQEVITALKAVSKKEMGLVMKTVLSQHGSQVDGKEVQKYVMEILK